MKFRQRVKKRAKALMKERGLGYAQAHSIIVREKWDDLGRQIGVFLKGGPSIHGATLLVLYELADGRAQSLDEVVGSIRARHGDAVSERMLAAVRETYTEVCALAQEAGARIETRGTGPNTRVQVTMPGVQSMLDRVVTMRRLVRFVLEDIDKISAEIHERHRVEYDRWRSRAMEIARKLPVRRRALFVYFSELCDLNCHVYRGDLDDRIREAFEPDELVELARRVPGEDDGFPGERYVRAIVQHARGFCFVKAPGFGSGTFGAATLKLPHDPIEPETGPFADLRFALTFEDEVLVGALHGQRTTFLRSISDLVERDIVPNLLEDAEVLHG